MRIVLLLATVLCCALPTHGNAQSHIAVSMGVRDLVRAELPSGQLVQVRGFLETSGNGTTLRDADSGQKVDLDFSTSTVQMDRLLNARGASPVELTARIRNGAGKDKLTLVVIGGMGLTP